MADTHETQTQRSFQKQPTVFLNAKVIPYNGKNKAKKNKAKKTVPRFVRKVGLGFATPKTALLGNYVDRKCPFTGDVSIRGRIIKGVVKNNKMTNTITVRRDYLHYIRKYNRYEKRHSMTPAHASPCFRINKGDSVTIGECRPLSKTLRFNVLHVVSKTEKGAKLFKKF